MGLRIGEYGGYANGRPFAIGTPHAAGFIQGQFSTGLSTGATPTFTLSTTTRLVLIDTDQGCYINFGSSLSTPPTVTSTNGQHIAANVAALSFYVNPGAKLYAAST